MTEETLNAYKLVAAFGNENFHIDQYKKAAKKAKKLTQYSAMWSGFYKAMLFGAVMGLGIFSWIVGGWVI